MKGRESLGNQENEGSDENRSTNVVIIIIHNIYYFTYKQHIIFLHLILFFYIQILFYFEI